MRDSNFRDDQSVKRVAPKPVIEEAQAVAEPKVAQVDDVLAADDISSSVIEASSTVKPILRWITRNKSSIIRYPC